MSINVIIVEDEGLYRDMLRISLAQDPRINVVGAYADPHAVRIDEAAFQTDVAILDIELSSDINGFELGLHLRRQQPELGVVLLSNFLENAFIAAFRRRQMAGWSYLLKKSVTDMGTLSRAVKGAARGLVVLDPELIKHLKPRKTTLLAQLTPRQVNVLKLIAQGFNNGAIADRLGITVKSVENHINEVFNRLLPDKHDPTIHPRVAAVLRYLQETRLL